MTQTVLITGASSGIGKATALLFQQRGWNVIATMRNPEKELELAKLPHVHCLQLDVTDKISIQKTVAQVIQEFKTIEVVVNNAGYGLIGPFEQLTEEQIEKQFQTNVFGLMSVCKELIPHFRKQQTGTIVNVSSMAARVTFPFYSVYHASKWAVDGFSESLQFELKPFQIRVKIIEPGAIKTDFYGRSADKIDSNQGGPYQSLLNKSQPNMNKAGARGTKPEVVAAAIYKAATDRSGRIRYVVGKDAKGLIFLRGLIGERLWQKLISLVLLK